MRKREPKVFRPMSEAERKLAIALRDRCFTGHRLPVWQWRFVKTMATTDRATDEQGDYLRKMAGWYGVAPE
jgi:hypothetical protein